MKLNQTAKQFKIPKRLVWEAYLKVRRNKGSAGVDGVTMKAFQEREGKFLYKLWNRMSSGSYFPQAVRLVEIPKGSGKGKTRPLGIPTITDRIAQQAVVMLLEPRVDPLFHEDSYGYRRGRSAHQALEQARRRCWKFDWVLDLDISRFFDTIDHKLLIKAVKLHVQESWVLLYIERWLKVPYQLGDGKQVARTAGVAQGSVIGPILANLYLHYTLDLWVKRKFSHVSFERYSDDCLYHFHTQEEAEFMQEQIRGRLAECGLTLNEEKTRIVYCKDDNRKGSHENEKFDFLGYTFRTRLSRNRYGRFFLNFSPAISNKSKTRVGREIRSWKLHQRTDKTLEELAKMFNARLRGFIMYYGKFCKSEMNPIFYRLNYRLGHWVSRKFKRFRRHKQRALLFLGRICSQNPSLFAHWSFGVRPPETK